MLLVHEALHDVHVRSEAEEREAGDDEEDVLDRAELLRDGLVAGAGWGVGLLVVHLHVPRIHAVRTWWRRRGVRRPVWRPVGRPVRRPVFFFEEWVFMR